MPRKLLWTHGQDSQIRRRRCEGASWMTIAQELVLDPARVMARGRRLGLEVVPADLSLAQEDPARETLPAGHPASWDAINAGTVLQGQPYPLPFFRR